MNNKVRNKTSNQNDLFRKGEDFHLNACVGKNGGPYYYDDYSIGYFEAGERLFQSILNDNSLIDVLIYPLIFIDRHAIELGLKYFCKVLPILLDDNAKVKFNHELTDNWLAVCGKLKTLPEPLNDKKHIAYVSKVLEDFVKLDCKGETFRFPESIGGEPHLQDTYLINVKIFGNSMREMRRIFTLWFTGINILLDERAEYQEMLKEFHFEEMI